MKICIDPGHGLSNRVAGRYDPGAVAQTAAGPVAEADIVMDWGNELRSILLARGHTVVRTRVDATDAAPVGQRAGIARKFGCEVMVSLHCNAATGTAHGTETFYRGATNADLAMRCNDAVVKALGTRDRGIKLESASQHSRLAVLEFPRAVLIELGFIDHASDRAAMLDAKLRRAACEALADVIVS